ncbi:pig-Q [Spiromyces aspiralis]|uniref:Pig-Q n=1 Tax=Spiromyces aspiralis TaxID=68401 RepID=A0ACC1HM12_9FUNG|nr:pig-Q [Spiromyces aspiralis]
MSFYSAQPISLDIPFFTFNTARAANHSSPQDVDSTSLSGDFHLTKVLEYVNASGYVRGVLDGRIPTDIALDNPFPCGAASGGSDGSSSSSSSSNSSSGMLVVLWNSHLAVLRSLLNALYKTIFSISLRQYSAIVQQVEFKTRQWCFWTGQVRLVVFSHGYTPFQAKRTAYFINFWNTAWLHINDVILGCAMGMFLLKNAEPVSSFISETLKLYTIDSLSQHIRWLRGWPAGFKLNQELNYFQGELFSWLIEFWKVILAPLDSSIYRIVVMTGWLGVLGITMQTAIVSDLLSLSTLHIYWFYMVAARIYHWQVVVLNSLANLFRGKRINKLRNRVDSYDFSLDQLLLGTILFTLLVYLLPTLAVYYLTFTFCRIGVILIHGVLEFCLALLNHFPIFMLVFRSRYPTKLPGGVYFEICSCDASGEQLQQQQQHTGKAIPTVLHMRSSTLSASRVFFQYQQLWRQITNNYFSLGLIKSLFTGNVIPPVPRLQYSMFPED